MRLFAFSCCLLVYCASVAQESPREIEGITFASSPGNLYVPVREVGVAFDWSVHADSESGEVFLNERPVEVTQRLFDGSTLIAVSSLKDWGIESAWDDLTRVAELKGEDRSVEVLLSPQKVVINKREQRLRAYQGTRLIFETNVSTGKRDHETPSGSWTAGPEKARMRRSKLYDDAPMPWSIQVVGNIFLHGYPSVPKRPASHGCVRIPIRGRNPAKWLWNWIALDATITIGDRW